MTDAGVESLPLPLTGRKTKKISRALCVLLLLAKAHQKSGNALTGSIQFDALSKRNSWITTISGALGNRRSGDPQVVINFFLANLNFFNAARGTAHQGRGKMPYVIYRSDVLPLTNLRIFKTHRPPPPNTPLLNGEEIELQSHDEFSELATLLEKKVWKDCCVPAILQKLRHAANLNTIGPQLNVTREPSLQDISTQLVYHIRRTDGEIDAINLLDAHSDKYPQLCNFRHTHLGVPLLLAIASQKTDLVEYLLNIPELRLDISDGYGVTPLLKAASLNDRRLVMRLIDKDPNVITATNFQGANAIYEAAFGAKPISDAIIQLFHERGVRCDERSLDGFIPLSVAIWRNCHRETIEYLLKYTTDLTVTDKYDESLLYKAFKHRNYRALLLLVQELFNRKVGLVGLLGQYIDAPEERGNPLFEATRSGNVDKIDKLLRDQNCNVDDGGDVFERSPLHEAVEGRNPAIVQMLLNHNANPLRRNNHGRTPRDLLPSKKAASDHEIEKCLIENEQKWIENVYRQQNFA